MRERTENTCLSEYLDPLVNTYTTHTLHAHLHVLERERGREREREREKEREKHKEHRHGQMFTSPLTCGPVCSMGGSRDPYWG